MNRRHLPIGSLVQLLIETAQDTELLAEAYRDLHFSVDEESFKDVTAVAVDRDLFTQAISNLFDNAAKYSFNHTTVHARAGARRGTFFLAVTNHGIPIRQDERLKVLDHGYRGDAAKGSTGEGQGIGLWVIERIMRAHNGTVEVIPTTPDHLTEIRLYFPRS